MTYPEPYQPPEPPSGDSSEEFNNKEPVLKNGYPSHYPDKKLAKVPFYRHSNFYFSLVILTLFIIAAIVILKPNIGGSSPDSTPYYEDKVLVFPPEMTEWRLSPESAKEWPQYLCLIDGKWHKCHPVYMSPTSTASTETSTIPPK